MKTTKITLCLALLFLVGSVTFVSCKKKTKEETTTTTTETDDEQDSAKDNNTAENNANDMEGVGSQVQEDQILSLLKSTDGAQVYTADEIAGCANVTYDVTTKSFTVDFGAGCVGNDGKTRSGQLIYSWASTTNTAATRYRHPGFSLLMTANNYFVDGHGISGTHMVTNTTATSIPTGTNPGVNLTWSITATFTITKPNNGGTITWTCARTKELTNTSDTNCYRGQNRAIVWRNAKVKFNGTAGGTNAKGNSYNSTIANLVRDWTCTPDATKPNRHPFTSGTVIYTPSGKLPRTINYGSGACDKDATLTIGVNTYTFSLW